MGIDAMVSDLAHQRQLAHAFLDRLPADQLSAVQSLLETMLSPLDRKLAQAPVDDEPLTTEEAAAIQAGIASLDRNGGVSMEVILADLGLTMDEFLKMAETSPADQSNGNG
jgi:hypothetical protein